MSDQWYLSRGQERYGPYTWAELQSYAQEDHLDANDLIWSPDAGEWRSAAQTPGLFAAQELTANLELPEAAPAAEPVMSPATAPIIAPATTAAAETRRVREPRPARKLSPGLIAALATLGLVALVGGVYALFLRDTGETAALPNGSSPAPIAALDGGDWRDYPDLAVEQAAIGETLTSFDAAMQAGDLDAAVSHIAPEQQAAYRELIAANPDGMASFGELLAQAEMSFLSAQSATTRLQPHRRVCRRAGRRHLLPRVHQNRRGLDAV